MPNMIIVMITVRVVPQQNRGVLVYVVIDGVDVRVPVAAPRQHKRPRRSLIRAVSIVVPLHLSHQIIRRQYRGIVAHFMNVNRIRLLGVDTRI